jgi:hypothetical protein
MCQKNWTGGNIEAESLRRCEERYSDIFLFFILLFTRMFNLERKDDQRGWMMKFEYFQKKDG